jgi:hypothetical protein
MINRMKVWQRLALLITGGGVAIVVLGGIAVLSAGTTQSEVHTMANRAKALRLCSASTYVPWMMREPVAFGGSSTIQRQRISCACTITNWLFISIRLKNRRRKWLTH